MVGVWLEERGGGGVAKWLWWLVFLRLLGGAGAHAADPEVIGPLDLEQAIEYALRHHPALQVEVATEQARQAQVGVARLGYLPQVNLSAQLNAGSGNVLRGSLFPMPGIPTVSGPPTGRSLSDARFGSLFGVAGGWDVAGLVREMAEVDVALAEAEQARAASDVTRLAVAYAVADQFLDVLSRTEIVRAAQATLERMQVLLSSVSALVDQDLRPGADQSRAQAEVALASTQLIRAQQTEAVSRAELGRALGAPGARVQLRPGSLLTFPTASMPPTAAKNPHLVEAESALRASQVRRSAVQLEYLPRLELVGALWVRGSGLTSGALAPSPGGGIGPDTPNWAAGLVLTWPLLDLIAVPARARVESARVRASQARRTDVLQAIQTQIDSARQLLTAARQIAESTPVALQAAREAERQAAARYRSGLSSVNEIAEAERLLAQAEADDAVARLNVRRAELLLARAAGDLSPFLSQLRVGH